MKKDQKPPEQNSKFRNSGIPNSIDESGKLDYQDIAKKMAFEYSHSYIDFESKLLDGILQISESYSKEDIDIDDFLSNAVYFIHKNFGIADVSIGLRDLDGLYRYKAFAGFRNNTVAFKKTLSYTEQEFHGKPPYKNYPISKYTYLYLAEDSPFDENEREAFNWPSLISIKRDTLTKSLEGDYFNIHLIGPGNDFIGWIDISSTKQRTFPETRTIKWIELIGRIIVGALAIQKHNTGKTD